MTSSCPLDHLSWSYWAEIIGVGQQALCPFLHKMPFSEQATRDVSDMSPLLFYLCVFDWRQKSLLDHCVSARSCLIMSIVMQVTALQIASLKKVNKRTQILLLDKNGSTSKVIAKELSRKGFRKIRVVQVRPSGFGHLFLQSVLAV